MKICSLSLHQGDTESRKTLKNNFIFQLGTLYIYTESMNVSHFIYLFTNSCHHVSTNGKAPPHPQKTNNTHNFSVRSDEGLTLVTSAFQIFHGGNSTFVITFHPVFFRLRKATNLPQASSRKANPLLLRATEAVFLQTASHSLECLILPPQVLQRVSLFPCLQFHLTKKNKRKSLL